jgi:glycosyltransferase involved in cell wall biosynthesis
VIEVSVALRVSGERYLREALEALLAQTYERFELFAFSDVSNAATSPILAEYVSRDKRVRIARHAGHGTFAHVQFLLKEARTRYVAWLDSSDVCAPAYLERTLETLRRSDDLFCASDMSFIDGSGDVAGHATALEAHGFCLEGRMHALFAHRGPVTNHGVGQRERLLEAGSASDCIGGALSRTAAWLLAGDVAAVHEPLFLTRRMTAAQEVPTEPPFSEELRAVGRALRASGAPPDELADVFGTIARTITFENEEHRAAIAREYAGVSIDDLESYRLALQALRGR